MLNDKIEESKSKKHAPGVLFAMIRNNIARKLGGDIK